jgi:hypothetical protein
MRRRILAVALALVAVAASTADERAPFIESIRQQDLRADLFFLASESMQGRLTDTLTNRLAAEWIKARFERLGLAPAGPDGSYFHTYQLVTASLGPRSNRLALTGADGTRRPLAHLTDFYVHRFSPTARAEGPIVFAGFGIAAPERGHDDLRGEAVRGAILLVLDHEPGEDDPASPFDGVVRAEEASPLRKALAAQARGARGLLVVSDVHNHPQAEDFARSARAYWPAEPPRIERYTLAAWAAQVAIPVAQISVDAASALLRGSGRSLADLARAAETPGGITPVPLGNARAEITTSVEHHVVPDWNVLAILEGTDPTLRQELVLIGAHYDHDGAEGDRVFSGADDNGSGTVGLLEIAEAYALAAQAGRRPRRSVLFAAWNAEERGLLGAWAYTEAPVRPLDRTVAVLNLDMIGRHEEVPEGQGDTGRFRGLEVQTAASNANAVNIIGSTRSADLKAAVARANQAIGLELKFRYDNNTSNLMRRSDHWPFLQKGVPAVWFHTGLHPDYHTVNDRPERIAYGKMEKIVRLVYQTSWDLANAEGRPRLDAVRSRTAGLP